MKIIAALLEISVVSIINLAMVSLPLVFFFAAVHALGWVRA